MLKMICTVPEYLKNKKIFIWDVKRNSMVIFGLLAFRGISIAGFATRNKKYAGETFFNRPVRYIEDIEEAEAIFVVAAKCQLEDIPDCVEVFYYDELLRVNSDLKKKQVIIYGAGAGAAKTYKFLNEQHIRVDSFCVTDKRADTYMNLPLLSLNEIPIGEGYAVVISAENEMYKREMQYNLEEKGISEIYIDEFMSHDDLAYSAFIQSIYKAIQEKRKIYIYTKAVDENAKLLVETLKLYQIDVEGYLYSEEREDQRIEDVFEIAYGDISTMFVIVCETDRCKLQDACELLEEIGLSLGTFDYAGVRIPSYEYRSKPKQIADSLLGYCEYGEKIGFHVYGQENPDDIKILVLGSSTSNDGTFRGICWPKRLYRKMTDTGYKVTIYNGAHCGNRVVEELLRLLRDGWVLKPDYVISMSGCNDSGDFPFKNRFYLNHMKSVEEKKQGVEYFHGLELQESSFEFWYRMEKVMQAVSEEYGAKFLCYLQPMKFGKPNRSLFEECLHNDELREAHIFRNESMQNDFYRNIVSIFDDADDMFIDAAHYSEKAKEILADIVYQDIISGMDGW